jgi:hypothetical protein
MKSLGRGYFLEAPSSWRRRTAAVALVCAVRGGRVALRLASAGLLCHLSGFALAMSAGVVDNGMRAMRRDATRRNQWTGSLHSALQQVAIASGALLMHCWIICYLTLGYLVLRQMGVDLMQNFDLMSAYIKCFDAWC